MIGARAAAEKAANKPLADADKGMVSAVVEAGSSLTSTVVQVGGTEPPAPEATLSFRTDCPSEQSIEPCSGPQNTNVFMNFSASWI